MIDSWPILSIVTFMPLAGCFLLMIKGDEITCCAEITAGSFMGFRLHLFCIVALVYYFDNAVVGYQFEEKGIWLQGTGIGYHMGVDGISMPFILLNTFLTPLSIWQAGKSYYASGTRIYDRIFSAGNDDGRHVCVA